ncbi:2-C-methyl-D-erythritol 4-phosphate cytidylyltransferase [Anaerocolumna cellulosilytica]|uniref:2-C-methyl-D-erythritol 4-phosphate cytidylyltransferase n=2 Tax=Anaerocolumna cellulosilytica TaxID=433286 RepID=A0A6S6R144_9FIRM|nr:2-C-methyl-D-erythritol 4-phosphate cytidylyltransferase [Anaerocolumna cellulosilytica]
MNSKSKPKQFLEMHGKPIIIYTLEYFNEHPEIDAICIVCLYGWEKELERLLTSYNIHKVKWVTTGGETGHDSIFNGLKVMKNDLQDKDVVIIHDGVRPLISKELIDKNIKTVALYGNSITVEKANESIVQINDNGIIDNVPSRAKMRIAKAPQCFRFEEIWTVHEQAQKDGFKSIDSAHLLHYYGHTLHTVESTPYNIKIATPSDFYVFRALFEAMENSQIFGI